MVETISVVAGHGEQELFDRFDLHPGQVMSVIGPTGSGKTTLLEDIAALADEDTPSGRRVLINGRRPPRDLRRNPAKNPILLIPQQARAVQLLRRHRKGLIFVTCDPGTALLSDVRVVMHNGRVRQVLAGTQEEGQISVHVNRLEEALSRLREKLEAGEHLSADDLGPAGWKNVA